ncbi:hypothetical protein M0805_002344 [Coniferiporia weirii]|nr:hypothetical protein M0805_002344 [Coniferiporia weirii]
MSQTCPKLSDSGVCKVQDCPYAHNVVVCDECHLPFLSQEACDRHNATATHSHNAGNSILKCTLCSVFCTSHSVYKSHISGRKHQKSRVAHGLLGDMEPEPEKMIVPPNCKACAICRIVVPCHHWDAHIKGRRHILLQRHLSLSDAMDGTEDNRYGVEVEGDSVDFGIINSAEGGATNSSKSLRLTNNGTVTVVFIEARTSSQGQNSAFCTKAGTTRQELNHSDQASVIIEFACDEQRGRFQGRLELVFEVPSQKRRFVITRPILATVGDKADHEVLMAAMPFIQHKRGREEDITDIIECIPSPTAEDIAWANKIGIYDPPKSLISAAFSDNGKPSQIANAIRLKFMRGSFDTPTYARHFQVMLWIEEEKAKYALRLGQTLL